MEMKQRNKNIIWLNWAFAIWLICEVMFSYSIVSRLALVLFVGLNLLITHKLYLSYSWIWYGLFVLWSAIVIWTGHAHDRALALDMVKTVSLNLVFLCAFVGYCRYVNDIEQILNIYKWTIFAFCIPCFIGGIGSVISGERLSILDINSNQIAMHAAYASLIFIHDIFQKEKKNRKITAGFMIVFLLMTILLTGSRKGLIIPVIGLYVLVCSRRPRRFLLYTVVIALVGGVALYLLLNVDALYKVIGHRVEPILQFLQGESFEESSMESRLDYIQLGWDISKQSPIWGFGLDNFRRLRYSYGTYSHCNYIEVLVSSGWVGLVIYYLPYLYALCCAPRAMRRNKELAAMALAILVPYIICDYMVVTYFTRAMLLLPMVAMHILRRGGGEIENQAIS